MLKRYASQNVISLLLQVHILWKSLILVWSASAIRIALVAGLVSAEKSRKECCFFGHVCWQVPPFHQSVSVWRENYENARSQRVSKLPGTQDPRASEWTNQWTAFEIGYPPKQSSLDEQFSLSVLLVQPEFLGATSRYFESFSVTCKITFNVRETTKY